ncbi:hypothetical protein PENTCL1PPCAC_3401, partial [Pristionchus entomophagus]
IQNAKTQKVDALIKLRFRDVRNKDIVACSRMTNVLGKEGKSTTKSDEQTMKVYPHGGERGIAISSKTIDFKAEMLIHLGIPDYKAILENVVFCNQENSTWNFRSLRAENPKFDDIFQLTGFVKFVEKGRNRLKELIETYSLARADFEGALAIQGEKQIAQARVDTRQDELKQAMERQREVQKEMNDLTKSLRDAGQQLQLLRDASHQRRPLTHSDRGCRFSR